MTRVLHRIWLVNLASPPSITSALLARCMCYRITTGKESLRLLINTSWNSSLKIRIERTIENPLFWTHASRKLKRYRRLIKGEDIGHNLSLFKAKFEDVPFLWIGQGHIIWNTHTSLQIFTSFQNEYENFKFNFVGEIVVVLRVYITSLKQNFQFIKDWFLMPSLVVNPLPVPSLAFTLNWTFI